MKNVQHDDYEIEETDGQAVIVRCSTKRRNHAIRVPMMLCERVVVGIAPYAFEGCGMKSLELPDTVQTLGQFAFRNCRLLSELIIPVGVETMGCGLTEGCSRLKSVVFRGVAPSRFSLEASANFGDVCVTHHIESGDYEAWYKCKLIALSV